MKDETDITIVLDRSGSMCSIEDDTIGGFNKFLAEQKAIDKPARLSLVLFDHEYTPVYVGREIAAAEPLTCDTYIPRGSTALLDAVGRAISTTGRRLSETPEADRPSRVVFVIVTDGHENCSKEYTRTMVRDRIEHQRSQYGWTFVYLGANQDSFSEASSIGIARQYAGNYQATTRGVAASYSTASSNIGAMRRGADAATMNWDPSAAGNAGGALPVSLVSPLVPPDSEEK